MTLFGRDPDTAAQVGPIWSPSRAHFLVTSVTGSIANNELESTIRVFDTRSVESAVASNDPGEGSLGRVLARMAATANADPITNVKWSPDGRSVAFLGRRTTPTRRLFIAQVSSAAVRQISSEAEEVTDFAWARNDLIYISRARTSDEQEYQAGGGVLPDIEVGTGKPLSALLFPHTASDDLQSVQLHRVHEGRVSSIAGVTEGKPLTLLNTQLLSVSPSGRYLIITEYVAHVPNAWEVYEPARSTYIRFHGDPPGVEPNLDIFRPQQYAIVDLNTAKISPLIWAPVGAGAAGYYADPLMAVWASDEKEVAVSNTFLPIASDDRTPAARTRRACTAAVIEISSRSTHCLQQSPPYDQSDAAVGISILLGMEWRHSDTVLALNYSGHFDEHEPPPSLFRKEDGTWKPLAGSDTSPSFARSTDRPTISVKIEQGLNTPPVLAATDNASGKTRIIWNPNPQLSEVRMSAATTYRWHDRAGHQWTGGLFLPLDYVAGTRYPLVIQTHGFTESTFLTDGAYSTANAARPLASRGLVVLQVREIPDAFGTVDEARVEGLPGYLAAIEKLSTERLVDAGRVGIIGFSRTGWYVLDSLIRAPQYFRAATLAESTYMSLNQYLLGAVFYGPSRRKDEVVGIGSEPFGPGITRWLTASPGFNTDKIQAPVLFEANNPIALIGAWDIYASLRLQDKPADLLYFRNGAHVLRKPREVLASQETTVDWYDFWLNDHESPDSEKSAQYARWRELRIAQRRQDAERTSISNGNVREPK